MSPLPGLRLKLVPCMPTNNVVSFCDEACPLVYVAASLPDAGGVGLKRSDMLARIFSGPV
jgi:hypothetical protein